MKLSKVNQNKNPIIFEELINNAEEMFLWNVSV